MNIGATHHMTKEKCIFLGYALGYKGVIYYHRGKQRLFISRYVIYDENVFPFHTHMVPVSSNTSVLVHHHILVLVVRPSPPGHLHFVATVPVRQNVVGFDVLDESLGSDGTSESAASLLQSSAKGSFEHEDTSAVWFNTLRLCLYPKPLILQLIPFPSNTSQNLCCMSIMHLSLR